MNQKTLFSLFLIPWHLSFAQNTFVELNSNWQFFHSTNKKWYPATVPGTIHTDLLENRLIPDPYFRDNESKLQWIGEKDWEYRTSFNVETTTFASKNIEMIFDGLDTYAAVYLNDRLILQADNMFRAWSVNVKQCLKINGNELRIQFFSAQNKVDSISKSKLPLVIPDNPRVYARKAQYHFGWDWGPKFVTCGIWKKIMLTAWDGPKTLPAIKDIAGTVKLIQQKDSIGTTFYFEKDGKPIYCKGANWIPAELFLPRLKKEDYRRMLLSAKDANMNMLRVWGGGIYEADAFYELCDSLGIMVWQDLMFAGGMVPGDEHFFNNVKEEVKYQTARLRNHPCIVLWCGNNEIDEAWHNWGWQQQFNLHGNDSAKIWSDYTRLFNDSLKKWMAEFDGTRPYISTSPMHGWGHAESFIEGDSHYWGVWWGVEDWEVFKNKTGRFVSEYGMQAMPNWKTLMRFTNPGDRALHSPVIRSHQKATDGFKKLDHYLSRYFIGPLKLAKLSLENYTYLTQCLQYYILKNCIATHRSKYPANMGTLLWQLNDCWPVSSWSITDYSRQPKAAWYAVKEAYRDDVIPVIDSVFPKNLKLKKPTFKIGVNGDSFTISSDVLAKYVNFPLINDDDLLSDNYFDLHPGEKKTVKLKYTVAERELLLKLKVKSLYDVIIK